MEVKGQTGNLYLVRAVTSEVIVVFQYNLFKIFSMMRRRVAYKTIDSMSKVKVKLEVKGQNIVVYTLIGPYFHKLLLDLRYT